MALPLGTCGLAALAMIFATSAQAENVEITLADDLDGVVNSYCLDIAGGNKDVDPANGLQAHTCYSYQGALGTDQIFDSERFTDNVLYMPEYDVCASLASTEAGATVELAACDGSDLQGFVFSDTGMINPASAPTLCLTAGEATRFGRSKKHQIKELTLEPCSDELASHQQWRTRTSDD